MIPCFVCGTVPSHPRTNLDYPELLCDCGMLWSRSLPNRPGFVWLFVPDDRERDGRSPPPCFLSFSEGILEESNGRDWRSRIVRKDFLDAIRRVVCAGVLLS